jgi:hypothetical protein
VIKSGWRALSLTLSQGTGLLRVANRRRICPARPESRAVFGRIAILLWDYCMSRRKLALTNPFPLMIFAAILALAGSSLAVEPKEKVLYSFSGPPDGAQPEAGLIFDAAGSLYGTTTRGGTHSACDGGCGTAFKLKPNPDGRWTNTVLYSFGTDGEFPTQGLTLDTAGNLYGVNDGNQGYDIVFELKRTAGGPAISCDPQFPRA